MPRRPDVDTVAVQQDAALLDVLATRGDLGPYGSDPMANLLGAWVAAIDDGIDPGVAWKAPVTEPVALVVGPRRRRRAGVVVGATVTALVVSSGAAAAVTGDPLAVVRAPIDVIRQVMDGNAKDQLPEPAAPPADTNKLLADAQRALAQGDRDEAARLLGQAQALLGENPGQGQEHRIDKLQQLLEEPGKPDEQTHGKPDEQTHGKPDEQTHGKPDEQTPGKPDEQTHGKPDDTQTSSAPDEQKESGSDTTTHGKPEGGKPQDPGNGHGGPKGGNGSSGHQT